MKSKKAAKGYIIALFGLSRFSVLKLLIISPTSIPDFFASPFQSKVFTIKLFFFFC